MTVSEKIVENTLLQAVARVAMVLTLPLLLAAGSFIGGSLSALSASINLHATDIALLQSAQAATDKRLDASDTRTQAILDTLQKLSLDTNTTRVDVGYLRTYIEELKRREKGNP